ncbi:MAG: shikimate dehydrogenase [Bacteroidales bacterium]|nr:shikimate dehydrogenase [Bacteroidales bacterium]
MEQYGLLGHPLSHSFSKKFFTEKFENEVIDAKYDNFDLDNLDNIYTDLLKKDNLKGFNVTIPYKKEIIKFLDDIDDTAKEIGAVNVVKVTKNQDKLHLKGYNSDVVGFMNSIKPMIKPFHKKALILGTGGASLAVKCGLEKLGIETMFVSRTPSAGMISYEQITKEILQDYSLIVNCTPLGTFPKVEGKPDLPYEFISETNLLYDLVYNPELTTFLNEGKKRGAAIKNGNEMLILQAIESWKIWNS